MMMDSSFADTSRTRLLLPASWTIVQPKISQSLDMKFNHKLTFSNLPSHPSKDNLFFVWELIWIGSLCIYYVGLDMGRELIPTLNNSQNANLISTSDAIFLKCSPRIGWKPACSIFILPSCSFCITRQVTFVSFSRVNQQAEDSITIVRVCLKNTNLTIYWKPVFLSLSIVREQYTPTPRVPPVESLKPSVSIGSMFAELVAWYMM